MTFSKWLDTYCEESDKVNLDRVFEVFSGYQTHWIPCQIVIDSAKSAGKEEQEGIKKIIVQIDFKNGDPMHFFKHLAEGLANQMDKNLV